MDYARLGCAPVSAIGQWVLLTASVRTFLVDNRKGRLEPMFSIFREDLDRTIEGV